MSMPSSASETKDDYFENHQHGTRWPFTIYHHPIEASLGQHVAAAAAASKAKAEILVFGCGMFHEASLFPRNTNVTLVDADDRLVPFLNKPSNDIVKDIVIATSAAELDAKLKGPFDLIIAKEVIEHILDAPQYLALFQKKLRSQGVLWLSTPNYGDWPLPILEQSFLEFVAYLKGFSRKHIHPNKYSEKKLTNELSAAGFTNIHVKKTPIRLALIASCRKP